MKRVRIDFFRLHISSQFSGARAYLDVLEGAIPEAYDREKKLLAEKAKRENWDYPEYDCGQQELEAVFEFSVPKVLSYSYVMYLHSVAQTALIEVVSDLESRRDDLLRVKDLSGDAIDSAHRYLSKVCRIPTADDQGWQHLRDLATLREVIVERGGIIGDSPFEQKKLRELASRLTAGLTAPGGWDKGNSQLKITYDLCRYLTDEVTAFFERLLEITRAGQELKFPPETKP